MRKKEFRPVELEISKCGRTVRQVIEIDVRTTTMQLLEMCRSLLRQCGWDKVRVGVGSTWSRWIEN